MPFDITILQDQGKLTAWVQVSLVFRLRRPQGVVMCSVGNWTPVNDSKSDSMGSENSKAQRVGNTIGKLGLGASRTWIWNPIKAEMTFFEKDLRAGRETSLVTLTSIMVVADAEARVVGQNTPTGVSMTGSNIITKGRILWRPGLEKTFPR